MFRVNLQVMDQAVGPAVLAGLRVVLQAQRHINPVLLPIRAAGDELRQRQPGVIGVPDMVRVDRVRRPA
jgi:hypothetical protein